MATDDLTGALHACAAGLLPLEAGVALLASNGTFLHRGDFTSRFIQHGTSSGTPMAAIDWDAAITALQAGELPCSRRRTPHPPASSQPRRRHPRRPRRHRHRNRRRQHQPTAHRHPPRSRETTVTSSCRRQYYFFSTPEIPPSASEKIRTSAFLTSESLSSRSSDSSRAGSRSIVASPPEAAPSRAENRSRHRYERITPARLSRISVWRTASCSLAWPRSASTEVHRVANHSLSASDWISSSVLKSTRQIRKSGSDGRIIDIAHYHRRALGYQPAHPAQCSRCQPLAASY